jgi:hypothetical protein
MPRYSLPWTPAHSALRGRSASLASLLAAGLLFAACGTSSPSPGSPTPAGLASPSPVPTTEYRDAQVLARIPLPHPDVQTAIPEEVAVTDQAIWVADARSSHLVRIDLATNRVSADVAIEPAILAAGAAGLWMLSPWGEAPSPPTVDLSRVNLESGGVQVVAHIPTSGSLAVGLGGVWVMDDLLRLYDSATGHLLRQLPAAGLGVDVACGALWTWQPGGEQTGWLLERLDPATGHPLAQIPLPDGVDFNLSDFDGLCWTYGTGTLYGIAPDGSVVVQAPAGQAQIAGGTVWAWTTGGVVQRLDPRTGQGTGPAWRLPQQDLHQDPKGMPDWRLLSAGGSLWLLAGDEVVRFAIPTAP